MTVKEKCKGCIHIEYCGGSATLETDRCFFKITTQEAVWKNPNKWIPVSERLPEKNDVYLVAVNSWGCPTRDVDGFMANTERKWEVYGNMVIAWMPLPEPYKAERSEE